MVEARDWEVGCEDGDEDLVFNGDRVSVQESEKFRIWMVVRVAQQCACT